MLPPQGSPQLAPLQEPEFLFHVPLAHVYEALPMPGAPLSLILRVVPWLPAVAEALQLNDPVVQLRAVVVQLAQLSPGHEDLL